MTPAQRAELDRQDRKRRREEALLLALLLLFLDNARKIVPHAIKLGVDPARAAGEVITGAGLRQPGIVPRLAIRLAATHAAAAGAVLKTASVTGLVQAPTPRTLPHQNAPQGPTVPPTPVSPASVAGNAAALPQVTPQAYRVVATEAAERMAANVRQLVGTVLQTVAASDVPATLANVVQAMREAFDARGYSPKNPAAAEAQAVTLAASAWAAGSWTVYSRPEVWAGIKGFEFVTFRDERVCKVCQPRDGVKLPRDDPWWLTNYVPIHYRCRCNIRPLMRDFTPTAIPNAPPAGKNFGARPDTTFGYSFNGTR